ncbi:MAG TPA: dTDP-4-dehydrorhamnose reductase [Candidatus Dormibacteraeota bacterium]|nr:dTDP-4-dehydrorhamnose reductase [Candidatus Dormibacteraeota bacterium]
MRVLITGAGGQLGSDLRRLLPEALALDRQQLSVTDLGAVEAAVRGCEVVVNCAAYNAVDAAELDPGPALAVNVEGAANVALACRKAGARLIHFSTNYVFDGSGDRPFSERDQPRPLGAYARSKLEGERRVLQILPEALVVRSAGLFGVVGSAVKGGSFPERVVRKALAGERLRVVVDQRLNPTYTADLAAAVVDLLDAGLSGVVHLVAEGCCSYWELAVETLRLVGLEAPVEPLTTAELGAAAPRPGNGCLVSERVPALRPWQAGLAAWWAAWREQDPITVSRRS